MTLTHTDHSKGADSVARFQRKLSNRFDCMRHRFEGHVLAEHAALERFLCAFLWERQIIALRKLGTAT